MDDKARQPTSCGGAPTSVSYFAEQIFFGAIEHSVGMRAVRLGSVATSRASAQPTRKHMKFRKSLLVGLCAASLGGVMAPMTRERRRAGLLQ